MHLVTGFADRRRGCNHFGSHGHAVDVPGTEVIDRGFIQPDEGSKRPTNEMQLVLNNQIGRSQEQMVS